MKSSILIRIIVFLLIYFGLRQYGGVMGNRILYPINLLVTFLHELGHGLGAIITGGEVDRIQISQDGSGYTATIGGNRAIILMGGYLGSAIFGNILFYIGARVQSLVKPVLALLAASMLFTAMYWFNSIFTTGFLFLFSGAILLIIWKTNFGREVLMFLGLTTIIYIIQDFNVGPSSDLSKYAEIMVILPASFWMYLWLFIALALFFINMRLLFKTPDYD